MAFSPIAHRVVALENNRLQLEAIESECPANWRRIGRSREGREIRAYVLGYGKRQVSITAGAHADEPVGPLTAKQLPRLLSQAFPELLERYTFHVAPDVNPDGAARNRAWTKTAAPCYDFKQYFRHRVRELPGDDVEYNYGDATSTARPENRAVMDFLRPHAPYAAHFSLHGMALAEGAWFLICREWAARTAKLREELRACCAALDFPLHDMDRHGEKGFHRIAAGFCTTPTSCAMRDYFLAQGDRDMAARFLPSSMEYVASLGGEPLCMVSELPLFTLRPSESPLEYSNYQACVEATKTLSPEAPDAAVDALMRAYDVQPVPIRLHMRLQLGMLLGALDLLWREHGG